MITCQHTDITGNITRKLTFNPRSKHQSESMVRCRRSSLHNSGFGHGAGYDTGFGLPVLWPRTAEVCFEHDMGMYGLFLRDHIPMVFLGIFLGVFAYGKEWLYWRPTALWLDEYIRSTKSRKSTHPRIAIQLLSGTLELVGSRREKLG